MNQTITIKCECAEAIRELKTAIETLTTILTANSNGKPSKQKDRSEHNGDEFITVAEFAKRVHRSPQAIFRRIRNRRMPEGTVFDVMGHMEIDWTAWQTALRNRAIT